jgi:glucokinase
MKRKYAAAVDVGGTNTKFAWVDNYGELLGSGSVKTGEFRTAEELIQRVYHELKELNSLNWDQSDICGIGVGAPNANYHTGCIHHAPNLDFAKSIIPFTTIFSKVSGLKCKITNDANAAAIGEKIYGKAKDIDDFMVITLGTGLGSGIYTGGQVLYGADGMAGEMGHTCFIPEGRKCGCGRSGCIERYVSIGGVKTTFLKLTNGKLGELGPRQIESLALKGNKNAIKTYQLTGEYLGFHLSSMAALFSPEAIFLSGGLAQAGELILTPLRQTFETNLLNHQKGKIKIELSGLEKQKTALLGAAALAFSAFSE